MAMNNKGNYVRQLCIMHKKSVVYLLEHPVESIPAGLWCMGMPPIPSLHRTGKGRVGRTQIDRLDIRHNTRCYHSYLSLTISAMR